eukprot:CAMPEP_0197242126 /NCGR_PEP_ID=MMETSP1429-20130617/7969_1 /TAXON_ID=49237 /ORGANISM="Chaetoceros  sp., Strain UNC1202" /LENGTH=34 /DNA_ID=CAMNT_0042702089 /DNA_START=173 /DNA_END=273 /DNA_ORIENTATION=+
MAAGSCTAATVSIVAMIFVITVGCGSTIGVVGLA